MHVVTPTKGVTLTGNTAAAGPEGKDGGASSTAEGGGGSMYCTYRK
jgi:hypothetical protein